jgi:hypothetical protein
MGMSQSLSILNHLIAGGSLTPLESLNLFGCLALSQRIGQLKREGYPIKREMVTVGLHKRVARYEWDWDAEKIPCG